MLQSRREYSRVEIRRRGLLPSIRDLSYFPTTIPSEGGIPCCVRSLDQSHSYYLYNIIYDIHNPLDISLPLAYLSIPVPLVLGVGAGGRVNS